MALAPEDHLLNTRVPTLAPAAQKAEPKVRATLTTAHCLLHNLREVCLTELLWGSDFRMHDGMVFMKTQTVFFIVGKWHCPTMLHEVWRLGGGWTPPKPQALLPQL